MHRLGRGPWPQTEGRAYLIVHELKRQGRLANPSTANHDHLVQGQGALTLTLICSHPAGLLRLQQVEELWMRKTDMRGSLVSTQCNPSTPGTPNPDIFRITLGVIHHTAARAAKSRENGDGFVRGTAGRRPAMKVNTPSALPHQGECPKPGALPAQVIWSHRERRHCILTPPPITHPTQPSRFNTQRSLKRVSTCVFL